MSTNRSTLRAAVRVRNSLRLVLSALGALMLLWLALGALAPVHSQEEGEPSLSLSISDLSITESVGTAYITVTLSMSSDKPVTTTYQTVEGSATEITPSSTSLNPGDFYARSGLLEIPAGSVTATIPITIANDEVYEKDESFAVTLGPTSSVPISKTTGTITITNDDRLAIYLPHAVNQPPPTWRQVGGSGVAFTSVAFDEFVPGATELYAGSQINDAEVNGIYRTSIDAGCAIGGSLERTLPGMRVLDIEFDSSIGIAGTFQGKTLYYDRRNDGWVPTLSDMNPNVYSVAFAGAALYAGTDAGVYKSATNGVTWELLGGPIEINSIMPEEAVLWIGSFQSGVEQLRLVDDQFAGEPNAGLRGNALQVWDFAFHNSTVFVATGDGLYYRGADLVWRPFGDGLQGTVIYSLEVMGKTLFAGTQDSGVWAASISDAAQWAQLSDGVSLGVNSTRVLDLVAGPHACEGQLFAATSDGIWVYGVDWSSAEGVGADQ